ncbi:MAG: SDR family oxidoreductase, partial [Acidimicrobiales bacterium]|nr:SDR family oxidoreductase [Acidimicrobiales bacterium]
PLPTTPRTGKRLRYLTRNNMTTRTYAPPAVTPNPGRHRAAAEIAEANNTDAEAIFARNSTGVPQGRYGTAEEVAAGVVFLASSAANYINGTCLTIDGGVGTHV